LRSFFCARLAYALILERFFGKGDAPCLRQLPTKKFLPALEGILGFIFQLRMLKTCKNACLFLLIC
jgi:hypothetical protein